MHFYEETLSAKRLPRKAKGPGNKHVSSHPAVSQVEIRLQRKSRKRISHPGGLSPLGTGRDGLTY